MGGRIDEKWWPPPPMIGIQQYCNPPLHLQRQADVSGDGDRTEMELLLGSKTSERLQAFEEGDQLHYKDVMEGNMVIVDFGDQPDEHGFIFGLNRIHREEGDPKYSQINVTFHYLPGKRHAQGPNNTTSIHSSQFPAGLSASTKSK